MITINKDGVRHCPQCGNQLSMENKFCEYCGFKNISIIKKKNEEGCPFRNNCKECENLIKERNSLVLSGEGYYCKLGFKLNREEENKLNGRKHFMGSYKSRDEALKIVYDCRDLFYEPSIVQMDVNKFNLFMKKKSNVLK